MAGYTYCDLRKRTFSGDINALFPDWQGDRERLAVFGAHDDDPLIGAGYAMIAAREAGANVFAVLFCKGDCGYSKAEQKDAIVEIRRVETVNAYARIGVPKENIVRFEYPDFSLGQFIGKELQSGETGTFLRILQFIRENKITRVMIPNGYREHTDHTAAYLITASDVIQAGDAVVADLGSTQAVKSYLQYSVWADFSPEDAQLTGEDDLSVRANRAIVCPSAVEDQIMAGIREYISQGAIISGLIEQRRERSTGVGYIELYIEMDPRPKLSFAPYAKRIEGMIER